MSREMTEYIQKVADAVSQEEPGLFRWCITINPGVKEGTARAQFVEPNDFDLHPLPEKFREVVRWYLRMMRSVYIDNDIKGSFANFNEMVRNLNRAAETQTNWVNRGLVNACVELMSVYEVRKKNFPDENGKAGQERDENTPSVLEELATTINRLFKLSLNDKNLDLSQSKRCDIYFFLGSLMKIYFKLGKLELAMSVEKALRGTRFELPKLDGNSVHKKYAICYLYYTAILYLDDGDFVTAETKLTKAMELLSYYSQPENCQKQIEQVLLVLLPLKLFNKGLTPSKQVWSQYPNLKYIYEDNLFHAIKSGNVRKLLVLLDKYQHLLLKKHLFYLFEHMKNLCYLVLIKKTVSFISTLLPQEKAHIIPLSALQVALDVAERLHNYDPDNPTHDLNYVECLLANQISSARIKGYISHVNKCIVLSKTNAFPPT